MEFLIGREDSISRACVLASAIRNRILADISYQKSAGLVLTKGGCASGFNSDIDIEIPFSKVDSPWKHATFGVFCFLWYVQSCLFSGESTLENSILISMSELKADTPRRAQPGLGGGGHLLCLTLCGLPTLVHLFLEARKLMNLNRTPSISGWERTVNPGEATLRSQRENWRISYRITYDLYT